MPTHPADDSAPLNTPSATSNASVYDGCIAAGWVGIAQRCGAAAMQRHGHSADARCIFCENGIQNTGGNIAVMD